MTPAQFRKIVWDFYTENGRGELPWRKTSDPYKILVSEMMLQQTQVERVIPYYKKFVKAYPTARALARAPLSDVLKLWQGLGYNRRAKFLHGAGKHIVEHYNGKMPVDSAELETIWGIGPYTARAVMTFAHNYNAVFIETNIRTAIIHHFFSSKTKESNTTIYSSVKGEVSDEEIAEVLKKVLPKGDARRWYSALMDYGTHLKRSGVKTNAKVKGYTKQSKFTGSRREARGAILRTLTKGPSAKQVLLKLVPENRKDQMLTVLEQLTREGMVIKEGSKYVLPK